MMDFEYEGFWWLPERPEQKVAGVLKFSRESGLQLRLITMSGFASEFLRWREIGSMKITGATDTSHPFMLGSADGKPITLQDLHISASGTYATARIAFIGVHLPIEGESKFYEAVVSYTYQDNWIGMSGIVEAPRFEGDRLQKIEINYTPPGDMKMDIDGGRISTANTWEMRSELPREISLRQSTLLKIELAEHIPFDDFYGGFLDPIRKLLSFAIDRPISIKSVTMFSKNVTDADNKEIPIEVAFLLPRQQSEDTGRPLLGGMIFKLSDVKDRFGEVIDRWLEILEKLDVVCYLFFDAQDSLSSHQYYDEPLLQQQFLSLARAVEIYHRRRVREQDMTQSEHKKRVKVVVSVAPIELRDWLQEALQYSNKPTLNDRLIELLGMKGKIGEFMSALTTNGDFARKVKDTRNYLTHYDRELEKKAANGRELYHLILKLYIMLQAFLLHELGFSAQECEERIKRTSRYRSLR